MTGHCSCATVPVDPVRGRLSRQRARLRRRKAARVPSRASTALGCWSMACGDERPARGHKINARKEACHKRTWLAGSRCSYCFFTRGFICTLRNQTSAPSACSMIRPLDTGTYWIGSCGEGCLIPRRASRRVRSRSA